MEDKIKFLVTSNKVVVFSKTYCPYSQKAKEIFDNHAVLFHAEELDQLPKDEEFKMQDDLTKITGQSTVPSVWIAGNFHGGATELV